MSFDEEKWEDMRDCMILAMHHIMLGSEFKDEYWKKYNQLLSESRKQRGDNILRGLLGDDDNLSAD